MNIYVGNLAYAVTDDDLREAFGAFGEVSRANVGFVDSVKLWFRGMVEGFKPQKYVPDPKNVKVAEYIEGLMEVDNDDKNR